MIEMPFSAPLAFAGGIAAPDPHPERALWFIFQDTGLLVADDRDHPLIPHLPSPAALGLTALRSQYLGTLGTDHCFSCEIAKDLPAPAGFVFRGLRSVFGVLDDAHYALAGRALQIVDWDRTHLFCGRCGTPTLARKDERSRECPACKLTNYPRVAPAVMALIRRRPDEILLARSPRFAPGMFSALAGFVEPGETLEQCVHREVFEEVGVRVQNLRYFASQPWPFPHSMMIAFIADYDSGEINPDQVEIVEANWFRITDLPQLPMSISIARKLIDAGVAELAANVR
jgi:NAD+ diphosphatase